MQNHLSKVLNDEEIEKIEAKFRYQKIDDAEIWKTKYQALERSFN